MQDLVVSYLSKVLPYVQKFRYIIIGVIVLGVFVFTGMRIDATLQTDRNEETYNEQLTTIEQFEFNAEAVEKIRNLTKSDANIDGEIKDARTNPFR